MTKFRMPGFIAIPCGKKRRRIGEHAAILYLVMMVSTLLLAGCDTDNSRQSDGWPRSHPYYVPQADETIGAPADKTSSASVPDGLTSGIENSQPDSDTHPLDSDVQTLDRNANSPLTADAKGFDDNNKSLVDNSAGLTDTKSSLDNPTAPENSTKTHYYWLKGTVTTANSHWLRGDVSGAHLIIAINNISCGDFQSHVDEDVSRFCHKGSNTITFTYRPMTKVAMANIDLIESEHTPPIPPLSKFENAIDAPSYSSADQLRTVTKSDMFIAH